MSAVRFVELMNAGRLGKPTQAAVASALGIDASAVNHITSKRRHLPLATAIKVAELASVSLDWLYGRSEAELGRTSAQATAVQETGPPFGTPDAVRLVRHAAQIGAGAGYVDELPEPREYGFTTSWLRRLGYTEPKDNDPRLQVFKVAKTYGDSMEPTIRPDAILLADMGPRGEGHRKVEKGRIYVVDLGRGMKTSEKGLTVKRIAYSRAGRELVLWGDNRAYAPETVTLEEDQPVQELVRGLVRWVGQEVA